VLRAETFDNRTLNITALVEILLAVMIARGGDLTSLLGAAGLTDTQWLIGAAPALVLLILWELGKALARSRSADQEEAAVPVGATARVVASTAASA
jgi:Ca2+-transporting ATPase